MGTCPNCEWEVSEPLTVMSVEWRRDHSSENLATGEVRKISAGDTDELTLCASCVDALYDMTRDGFARII